MAETTTGATVTLEGWWDGAASQPATAEGWWDGAAVQPLVSTTPPANQPPVANAGADQSVVAGGDVLLDGSGSTDADGTIASYDWQQISGTVVALSGAGATRTFTTPNAADTLVFRLTVTDDAGATATDDVTVTVTVLTPNQPPTANAGPDKSVATGSIVNLSGSGSDTDGTIIAASWAQVSGEAVVLTGTGFGRTFTAPTTAGTLVFRLTVTDDDGATATDDVTITVAAPIANQITGDEPVFPGNVITCLGIVIPGIDDRINIFKRPLRPTDPNMSVGIYGTLWSPEDDSLEIGHAAPSEPTLNQYQIGIQTLVKDGDTERGLNISTILTNRVRAVLYRNNDLRVALASLYVQDAGFRESMRRWGVRSQRFMSNDIEGTFVTISVLDLWIETEMS